MSEDKKVMHKELTVSGVKYKLQKLVPSQWLKLRERCKNKTGIGMNDLKLMEEILEHIVVTPKIGIDDLDWPDLDELTTKAVEFQVGTTF